MKRFLFPLICIAALSTACTNHSSIRVCGQTPTEDTCYAKGISAPYCGVIDGHLIVAGGANFPGVPAAQGGTKQYYNAVYACSFDGLQWHQVGVLPEPMAYGVAVTDSKGMVFVGGCNDKGGLSSAFRLSRKGNIMRYEPYASLPFTLDNMAGALIDSCLYVVGGLKDGEPTAGTYMLDMGTDEWFECASIPGAPRMQPICAAQQGRLYVWGGYSQPTDSLGRVIAEECMVHSDGWMYDPQTDKWSPMPVPTDAEGHQLTLTGGVAMPWGEDEIVAVGGVNRNVFLGGIQGIFPVPGYLEHEPEWYRFNRNLLIYSVSSNRWRVATESDLLARAGTALVPVPNAEGTPSSALLIGGELKPGIRTDKIARIDFRSLE